MPRYDVHLYREPRLLFEGIEAGSPEEAAASPPCGSSEKGRGRGSTPARRP